MTARVHLTDRAMFDLDEIVLYSVQKWGEQVADKYLVSLDSALARIAESPGLLQDRPDTSLRLRFYPAPEHVLVCDVIGEDIFVLAFRGAVMDLPNRIVELEPLLIQEAELLAQQIERARQ